MAPATDRLPDSDETSNPAMQSAKMLDPERSPRPEASAIFFIPEILEMILLDVDLYTLLTSKRVCSTWKDLIQTSPKIRRALLFASRMIQEGMTCNIVQMIKRHGIFSSHKDLPPASEGSPNRPCTCYWRLRNHWRIMLLQHAPSSWIRVRCPGTPLGHDRASPLRDGPHRPYNCRTWCQIEISSDTLPHCRELRVGVVLECPTRPRAMKLYIWFRVLPQGDSEDYSLAFRGHISVEN